MLETLKTWDSDLLVFLNNLGIEQFDPFWIFVTTIESWIPLLALFIVLIFYYYGGKKGFVVFFFTTLALTVALTVTNYTKEYVERLRPNMSEEICGMLRILQDPYSFSFFSGHASSSFAITTFIVLMLRKFTKWIYLAYLWPILFVLSRIYVGVHYPTDLLVGSLVGIALAMFLSWICHRILERI